MLKGWLSLFPPICSASISEQIPFPKLNRSLGNSASSLSTPFSPSATEASHCSGPRGKGAGPLAAQMTQLLSVLLPPPNAAAGRGPTPLSYFASSGEETFYVVFNHTNGKRSVSEECQMKFRVHSVFQSLCVLSTNMSQVKVFKGLFPLQKCITTINNSHKKFKSYLWDLKNEQGFLSSSTED